ncbi:tRNA (adenosine(37)-N6)-threonylcarbamoyltransferase complex dimerization subunit type 1 TsaB [Variovorax sp. VNK109]|uniref:tRNA (adenosine(37)-N6)-threonylcarbamoyltransferase complex dimerization subunit type 1 TsaB n=1 Tax=Variovorax sp. VNK109 TaxID=3400919 RepID=UPI003BFC9FDD
MDTSTEVLSIAVMNDGRVFEYTGPGGAQASSALVPAIMALLAEAGLQLAQLDAIAFGQGPGSFTGLRTSCAVAQGLGFGAGVKLLPVNTLLAVAEDARHRHGVQQVVAVLDARMDEVYAAACDFSRLPAGVDQATAQGAARLVADPALLKPEAVQVPAGSALAGNAFKAYGARLPDAPLRIEALPTAAAMLRLAPHLLSAGLAVSPEMAMPLYIRDKVAQTTAEREAGTAPKRPR